MQHLGKIKTSIRAPGRMKSAWYIISLIPYHQRFYGIRIFGRNFKKMRLTLRYLLLDFSDISNNMVIEETKKIASTAGKTKIPPLLFIVRIDNTTDNTFDNTLRRDHKEQAF